MTSDDGSVGGPPPVVGDEAEVADERVQDGDVTGDGAGPGSGPESAEATDGPASTSEDSFEANESDGSSGAVGDDEALGAQDPVAEALNGLEAQVGRFHQRAENYEQIVRQMQSRIEQLQGDQVQALLKPVIQRLASLHAQAAEALEEARGRGELAEKDFNFFVIAIEDTLGLVDIESVQAAPGIEFNSRAHHASRAVPTDDVSLDRRVQRVMRQGFTYIGAERVFLPAQVSVYRYEPLEPAVDGQAPNNNTASEHGEGDPVE